MNYSQFSIGTKIQSYDSHGYYVMPLCGIVEKHLGNGQAIIKSFNGFYYSTVNYSKKVAEVEELK